MKNVYVVSYDIADDRRRTNVYNALKGWGDWMQYSVFRCELSPRARVEVEATLSPLINHREDQVLFMDLGPAEGRGDTCVTALGKPYSALYRGPLIF